MATPRLTCRVCDSALKPNMAQCPECGAWNSDDPEKDESQLLADVKSAEGDRIKTGLWDVVWGGGIVRTSTTLFGGLPGAGKSTLLLQLLDSVYSITQTEGIYIATEEVLPEIKMRADRLGIRNQRGIRMIPAMGGVDVASILVRRKPGIVVVDSLQGLVGEDDNQAIALLNSLKKFSGFLNAPSIIISHVTKAGDYSGLMTYQHAVDTLLLMTPDEEDGVRTLSVRKNRYGRAFISQYFSMTEKGLIPELDPPSEDPASEDGESDTEEDEEELDDELEDEEEEEENEPQRKAKKRYYGS